MELSSQWQNPLNQPIGSSGIGALNSGKSEYFMAMTSVVTVVVFWLFFYFIPFGI